MTLKKNLSRTYRRYLISITLGFLSATAFFLTLFPTLSPTLSAQTIHVLIAADAKVDRAGEGVARSVQIDQDSLVKLFRANVPETQLEINSLPIAKVWADDILTAIDQTEVASDDTFVFFYTGHGAYDEKKKEQFFQLAADHKGNPYPGQRDLYRNEVIERIQKKNPRLVVMISDCCNVFGEARTEKNYTRDAFGSIRTKTTMISPAFESLFIYCKGMVDITSSKLGEASGVDAKTWRGSCFTYPFVDILTKSRDNEFLDWKTFVDELTPEVQKAFAEAYPNGARGQYKQTVYAYSYPGMPSSTSYGASEQTSTPSTTSTSSPATASSAESAKQGPRFGVRAVTNAGGGIRVTQLIPNSPGEKAGFEIGDVILEINDKTVNSEQEYSDAVDASPKQMRLKLKNSRDGKIITPTIEMGW